MKKIIALLIAAISVTIAKYYGVEISQEEIQPIIETVINSL